MRTSLSFLFVSAIVLSGCGGTVTKEGTGGSSGSGGSAGAGGSATGGTAGVGGTAGFGGNAGSAGGGAAGAGGAAGFGGQAGFPGCCSKDVDCWQKDALPPSECVNGVCKPLPPQFLCWSDNDCGGAMGSCSGASVCPCGADCFAQDQLGKCAGIPGCCSSDTDCSQKPNVPMECVSGNCEMKPPPGQCWSDADCGPGSCNGQCVCPCGAVCACGGQMGWCEGPPPPPPQCCSTSMECGPGAVCAQGVCKPLISGACWSDAECPKGQTCSGASVCPCNAFCGIADTPGKCM